IRYCLLFAYALLYLFLCIFCCFFFFFFFSSRRRHTRFSRDWSSDVCSSDLQPWTQVRLATQGPVTTDDAARCEQALVAAISIQPFGDLARGLLTVFHRQAQSRLDQAFALEIGRASCRERVVRWEVARRLHRL